MSKIAIDGITAEATHGKTILQAARELGIDIPTLCDDPRLKPVGACRLCLVEIDGQPRPAVSCMTELKSGMSVRTDSPALHAARRMNLKMLARRYPREAFTEFPDEPFHKIAREYGLTADDFTGEPDETRVDNSNPYIRVDLARCIDCYRCVRICDELQGQFVWQIVDRGNSIHVMPDSGTTLGESSCVSCGACVDTCPTGALEDRSVIRAGTATAWTRTVCPYCGTGCEMNVGTRDGKIVEVEPVLEAPVSRGHLCVKGRYAFGFMDADDRITEPMIRRDSDWQTVSWNEAIEFTAERLKEITEKNGRDSVAVLGSARATNEENYLAQKFARLVVGTNNVDCCARVCHTPSAVAMKLMLGTGAATNSFSEIELTRTMLVCGANPTENHPIVGERMKQAVLRNGTKLIVIDPRKTELTRYADIHLQLRPGTNILLLNALAAAIIEEGLVDRTFIDDRVLDFEKFAGFVADYSPELVAERCGVAADLIRAAARMYASEKPAMCFHGLGVTEHTQGTEGVMCLINLALITGNIGKPGTGVNPLRGQNNVQGAAHMGCDPGILTGSVSIKDGRNLFESVWKAPIPERPGLNQIQMIDAARDGRLKALWTIGYDVFLTNPNAHETGEALRSLDLLIVQDMFLTETAREFGHVFLPVASSFEKDGTFMNAERRIQRVRKVMDPRGNSRSDQEIICDLASAMDHGRSFDFGSAEDVWNEIRQVWPPAAGVTYRRLEHAGLQWPCLDEEDPGTEILHVDSFAGHERTALRTIKYRPTPETESPEFPFVLNTGRSLFQFNAGTMTLRTDNSKIRPVDLLSIHPSDAARLELNEGDEARITSAYGSATLPATITSDVRPGELFATFHTPSVFLNRVTGPHRDRFAQSPEYKVTAVRVERVSDTSERRGGYETPE